MKLRIKGNSIRLRLTKTEVATLAKAGYLEEKTQFAESSFIYALQADEGVNELTASFTTNKITVFVPAAFTKTWPLNDVIGTDSKYQSIDNNILYLLLEKDFVCLDETSEDQSDNFENPRKNC